MPEPTYPDYLPLRKTDDAPPRSPEADTSRFYADGDGALRVIQSDGTDSPVAGAGVLPNPTNEGDVLTVASGEWSGEPPTGGGSGIPVADSDGVTVDTTTYDNPVTGSGKIATLVFPATTTAFAIALEGDAFPRWCFSSDPMGDDLTFGDGTFDPDGGRGAFMGIHAKDADGFVSMAIGGGRGNINLGVADDHSPTGVRHDINHPFAFTDGSKIFMASGDPSNYAGNLGDIIFRTDGDVGSTIYRCTVAGTTGDATWAAIL